MSNSMTVRDTTFVDVEIDIDTDDVIEFINSCADSEDKRKITAALGNSSSPDTIDTSSLEGDIRMDIATKIAKRYSLLELMNIEDELLGDVVV